MIANWISTKPPTAMKSIAPNINLFTNILYKYPDIINSTPIVVKSSWNFFGINLNNVFDIIIEKPRTIDRSPIPGKISFSMALDRKLPVVNSTPEIAEIP